MAGKVVVTGFRELDRKLADLGKDALKIARKAMREKQKEIKKQVQSTMPVGETKEAKKGVGVKSGKRSRVQMSVNTVIFNKDRDSFHTAFVEYGTSKQPAQGTIRKVWESNKTDMRDSIIEKIWDGIDKHTRGK